MALKTERAVLTALPAGVVAPEVAERAVGDAGARLVLVTAFVTPRVDVGATSIPVRDLDAFAVWPDALEQWALAVTVDGSPVPAVRHPDRARPDAGLWVRLFDRAVVRTRVFDDLSKKALLTSPVSEVARIAGELYASFTAPTLPAETALAAIDDSHDSGNWIRDASVDRLIDALPGLYDRLDKEPRGAARDGLALGLAGRFYSRPEAERPRPAGTTIEDHLKALEAPKPEYDFHELCASMGDYPRLLRALGLAVDLLIDEGVLGTKGWVAIRPAPGQGPEHLLQSAAALPRTRYHHEPGLFVADDRDASPDPGIRRGMLDMRRHTLTTLDVDSAGPQLIQVLANASQRQRVLGAEGNEAKSGQGDLSSLPALRTGGVTVMRPSRRGVLAASLGASAAHEKAVTTTDMPPVLWSDDVTRGWRVDVFDRNAKQPGWRSLGAREGRYVFAGDPVDLDGEEFEAYVKSTSASTDTVAPKILYTSEAVVGWDGWSLAAPRPGRVITPAGVEERDDSPPTGFPLVVAFEPAAGSLPVLRYGRTYQIRIRTADLAGNSHTIENAPDGFESDPIEMTRWEPVLPPEVVPLHPFGEGESLLRVVLRSTRDVDPATYVALDRVVSLPGHPGPTGVRADWRYRAEAARHLVAPKSAQLQAERHGGFDSAFQPGADPAAAWPLLDREERTFYDLPGVVLVDQGDPDAVIARPAVRGGELPPHCYLTAPVRPDDAGYLPDQLARTIAVHDLPGRPVGAPLTVALATSANPWPDYRAAMVRVVEGPLGSSVDPGTGVVTLSLPKSEVCTVRLTSLFDKGDLRLLAVWDMVLRANANGEPLSMPLAQLEAAARSGRLWTLTPWITMTFVHAVEMPLDEPRLVLPGNRAQRFAGETFAALSGQVRTHAKSTGRVDVDARWREPRDDVGRPPTVEPATWVAGAGHVGGFAVQVAEDVAQTGRNDYNAYHALRHELGDTKHRMVTYTTTATTRFREYFPPAITEVPSLITTTSEVLVDVPSSRRPEPPDVAYVVPLFDWDEARYGRRRVFGTTWPPAFRRTRRGGGLRVYLRRPWWSSGEGERLAVVLPNQGHPRDVLDLGGLLGGRANAAALKEASEVLQGRLTESGVKGATTAAITRAFKSAAGRDGRYAELVKALHSAMNRAGVAVPLATLERAWAEVSVVIGPITIPDLTPSPLDENERSAFVTRWGRDPTVVAGNPSLSPSIADFVDRDGYALGLGLANPQGERVAIATYVPEFDADRDLWFVDLHLAEHDHFMPFIRLALARYQAHSIEGYELSEVRVGDFMQLMPTREVTVRDFGGTTAHVTVRGRAAYGAIAGQVTPSPDALRLAGRTLHVRAWVEMHPQGSPTDLDWEPATKSDTWLPLDELGGDWTARWLGQVELPEPKAAMAYRLAVEELQVHQTDEQNVARDPDRFGYLEGVAGGRIPVGLRLLWADRVPLTVVGGRLGPDAPERG